MSNWIKTTDRMPEDDTTEVLFRNDEGYIWLGTWNRIFEEWTDDATYPTIFSKDEIIAWCPIPEYDIKD